MSENRGKTRLRWGRRARRSIATALLTLALVLYIGHLCLTSYVFNALPQPVMPPLDPVAGVGSLSATQCAACHPDNAREWAESRHAVAQTNPVYQADLVAQGAPFFCAYCHAPLVEQRPQVVDGLSQIWPTVRPAAADNPRFIPALRDEGVTCVACHQRGGILLGPRDVAAPHPTGRTPDISTTAACAPCHRFEVGVGMDLRRPIIDTLAEWATYREQGGTARCVDCHMPRIVRPVAVGRPPRETRSHRMLGARDVAFLRDHVVPQDPSCGLAGGRIVGQLALLNKAGHQFPTADPSRRLEVALESVDAAGHLVEDSVSVMQRYIDLVHYYEPPDRDSSLRPHELRPVSLSVAHTEAVHGARLVVRFVLRDPGDPLAKAAGLDPLTLTLPLYSYPCALAGAEGVGPAAGASSATSIPSGGPPDAAPGVRPDAATLERPR